MENGRYVITAKGCPHCETFKKVHKNRMKEIKEIDISSAGENDEIWNIIDEMKIIGTPTVLDVKGKKICEIDVNDLKSEVRCIGDSEKIRFQGEKPLESSIDFVTNLLNKKR